MSIERVNGFIEKSIFLENRVEVTDSIETWDNLSELYNVPIEEIGLIDFNRSGICLPNNEVIENFRVRFKGDIMYRDGLSSWYALPVRNALDTNFYSADGSLYFKDNIVGSVEELMLDTCESSYKRGPNLLNLNSRSRSNCGGCRACVHNYKNLYDETVIHDGKQLLTKEDLERFFDIENSAEINVSKLDQIAVVTGLFGSEGAVVDHMKLVSEVAGQRGFKGELMYFGCEVNSELALDELSKLGNFSLVYAIDNFTKRDKILAKSKSLITIDDAKQTLDLAKERGMSTTFAYIAGIDSIMDMKEGFIKLKKSITKFPIINVYQVQTAGQVKIMDEDARKLEYYIQARKVIEDVMFDTKLRPRRWENYRPLWYKSFNKELLENKPYGN